MATTVAVVILNYNGRNWLKQFLPSVLAHSEGAEIVLADNGSIDDSIEFVTNHYPTVRIISNPDNHGYAGGYNYALKQIDTTYYILLNSDVEVTDKWLWPVVDLMERNSRIAACQPKILAFHQKDTFEYAGAAGGMLDKYGYPFCRGRVFDTLEKDTGQYNDAQEVFWATGACMFVRAEVFHALGGLDEDFFAHMEEIDLCWRMKNKGLEVWVEPAATVYHVGGGTLQKSNPHKTFLNFRNGIVMLYKNLPSHMLFPIIFTRLILDGIAGIKFILSGNFADCVAIIKAHFNFYANLRMWRRKRKQQNDAGLKPRSYLKGWFKYSIVWHYYIGGKKTYQK